MSTTQRKSKWSLRGTVLAVAAAALLAGCSSASDAEATRQTSTSTPTTSVPSTSAQVYTTYPPPAKTLTTTVAQAPVVPVPTTGAPATAPEAERQTYFGLSLPFGNRWVISDTLSNEARKVFFDSNRCGSAPGPQGTPCPGFAIVNVSHNNAQLPYDNPAFQAAPRPDGTKCYKNGVNGDDLTYDAPKTVDRVKFNSEEWNHTTQRQCAGGGGNDLQHSWRSYKRGLVVFDFGRYDVGPNPTPGVEELLRALR